AGTAATVRAAPEAALPLIQRTANGSSPAQTSCRFLSPRAPSQRRGLCISPRRQPRRCSPPPLVTDYRRPLLSRNVTSNVPPTGTATRRQHRTHVLYLSNECSTRPSSYSPSK